MSEFFLSSRSLVPAALCGIVCLFNLSQLKGLSLSGVTSQPFTTEVAL